MNGPIIASVARFVRAGLAPSVAVWLAACATPAPVVTPPPPKQTDDHALDRLRNATAALDCGQPCANTWLRSRAELTTAYDAGDWRPLALRVMQINHREDLAYFYLGRAAEGLGARSAASVYYKTAATLATGPDNTARCAASPDGCYGLSLLREVLTRTQIVDAERSRIAAMRRQMRPQSKPGQPEDAGDQSPAGNWVDPPPAH